MITFFSAIARSLHFLLFSTRRSCDESGISTKRRELRRGAPFMNAFRYLSARVSNASIVLHTCVSHVAFTYVVVLPCFVCAYLPTIFFMSDDRRMLY